MYYGEHGVVEFVEFDQKVDGLFDQKRLMEVWGLGEGS